MAQTQEWLTGPVAGATDFVHELRFSPDGKILASVGFNMAKASHGDVTSITPWDVTSRQQLGQLLTGHTDAVRSISFSPDGRTLASGGDDKSIILWDTTLESWLDRACKIANRNPTDDEWETYFGNRNYRKLCPKVAGPQK